MSESTETVFITKYALTKGIEERTSTIHSDLNRATIKGRYRWIFFFGNEWHRTREAAVARAEEMRKAKIASHERSIAKLQKLTFA